MKLVVFSLAALLLAACDRGPGTSDQLLARQQALDPPRMWRIATLDAAGEVRGVSFVCADTPLSQTFARLQAEVEGTPCRTVSGPVVQAGLSTLRCAAQGQSFAISSRIEGDPSRDFRLDVTVTPLGHELGPGREIRHFQRLKACPAGWRIGDQAAARG